MSAENPAWDELFELLGPIHDDVQTFARRIAGSNAEGDDVFQEAVLRAARKLSTLRDRARFRPWMCSIECHECGSAREQLVMKAAMTTPVLDVIDDDAAVGPAITKALAAQGVTDVEVKVAADAITVVVDAHATP